MNITDLVTSEQPDCRDVGIRYPDRRDLMRDAKRIYLELGVVCELHDRSISFATPCRAADWYRGAFERLTGHTAYNDWSD